MLEHIDAIEGKARPTRTIELASARAAATRWKEAAHRFEAQQRDLHLDLAGDADRRKELNDVLVRVECAMTQADGLKVRFCSKHLVYAPQPTYRPAVLPRFSEAIESGKWAENEGLEAELVVAFDRAAELMEQSFALPTEPWGSLSP